MVTRACSRVPPCTLTALIVVTVVASIVCMSHSVLGAREVSFDSLLVAGVSFSPHVDDAANVHNRVRITSSKSWKVDGEQFVAVSVVFTGSQLTIDTTTIACRSSQLSSASSSLVALFRQSNRALDGGVDLQRVWHTCLRGQRNFGHALVTDLEFIPMRESSASVGASAAYVMLKLFATDAAIYVRENADPNERLLLSGQQQLGHALVALTLVGDEAAHTSGGYVVWIKSLASDLECIGSVDGLPAVIHTESPWATCSAQVSSVISMAGSVSGSEQTTTASVAHVLAARLTPSLAFANDLLLVVLPYYYGPEISWHLEVVVYRLSRFVDSPNDMLHEPQQRQLVTLLHSWHVTATNLNIDVRAIKLDLELDRLVLAGSVGPALSTDSEAPTSELTVSRLQRTKPPSSANLNLALPSMKIDYTIAEPRLAHDKLALLLNWRPSDGAFVSRGLLTDTLPFATDPTAKLSSIYAGASPQATPAMPPVFIEDQQLHWYTAYANTQVSELANEVHHTTGINAVQRLSHANPMSMSPQPTSVVRYSFAKQANDTWQMPRNAAQMFSNAATITSVVAFPFQGPIVVAGELGAATDKLQGAVQFLDTPDGDSSLDVQLSSQRQLFLALYGHTGQLRSVATVLQSVQSGDASISDLELTEAGDVLATLNLQGSMFLGGLPYLTGSHLLLLSRTYRTDAVMQAVA